MYNKLSRGESVMKTAIALGTFDGLHTAHRQVLSLPSGYKKLAVTFKKPPKMVFSGENELLLNEKQKFSIKADRKRNDDCTCNCSKLFEAGIIAIWRKHHHCFAASHTYYSNQIRRAVGAFHRSRSRNASAYN